MHVPDPFSFGFIGFSQIKILRYFPPHTHMKKFIQQIYFN